MAKLRIALPSQDLTAESGNQSEAVLAATRASFLDRVGAMISQHLRLRPGGTPEAKRKAWSKGVTWELDFWDQFLAGRAGKWAADFSERTDSNLPLQPFLEEVIIAPEGSAVQVLDVGAGPFTFVGRTSPRWSLEITAIDPLAEGYDALLANYDITPPVRTRAIAAEDLDKHFAEATFDLVTARNSLDHVLDPMRAIRQMLKVVKPGASLHLQHLTDEAERNLYAGMHQWNFHLAGDAFVISGAAGETNVTETLAAEAEVTNRLYDGQWLVTTITRRSA